MIHIIMFSLKFGLHHVLVFQFIILKLLGHQSLKAVCFAVELHECSQNLNVSKAVTCCQLSHSNLVQNLENCKQLVVQSCCGNQRPVSFGGKMCRCHSSLGTFKVGRKHAHIFLTLEHVIWGLSKLKINQTYFVYMIIAARLTYFQ